MLNLFKKTAGEAAFGIAMTALVGKETVSAEEATAANDELAEAGIKGAQLINEASFTELTEKAGRVDAAEQAATKATDTSAAAAKATSDALAAAGAQSIEALVAQRDGYKVKADKFDKAGGAQHTTPNLATGKSDIEDDGPDANQKAIDELPHNKALDNNPLFAKRVAV